MKLLEMPIIRNTNPPAADSRMLGMDQQWDICCRALAGEHRAGLLGRHISWVRHDPSARDEISSHSRYFPLLTCGLFPFLAPDHNLLDGIIFKQVNQRAVVEKRQQTGRAQ